VVDHADSAHITSPWDQGDLYQVQPDNCCSLGLSIGITERRRRLFYAHWSLQLPKAHKHIEVTPTSSSSSTTEWLLLKCRHQTAEWRATAMAVKKWAASQVKEVSRTA